MQALRLRGGKKEKDYKKEKTACKKDKTDCKSDSRMGSWIFDLFRGNSTYTMKECTNEKKSAAK